MAPLAPAKRLAKDLRTLYTQPLPLYYLWSDASNPNPTGSLTSLDILLAGPSGTPYSAAVFKLHLDIPVTYPTDPPKAFFRTKIFHPNVEPSTGAVCLETLKRDWRPELTLADVLATIACLLIQPNPDSALNEEAGRMIHDGFERFAGHAKLMASIHAKVIPALKPAVEEALARGEEVVAQDGDENAAPASEAPHSQDIEDVENSNQSFYADEDGENSSSEEDKENDASLSPTPVLQSPPLPIRIGVKRPLGDLPTPFEDDKENENENERNIAANVKPANTSAASASLAKALTTVAAASSDIVKRQGLSEVSNRQVRYGMMPPPAKKQATARARVGIRRL